MLSQLKHIKKTERIEIDLNDIFGKTNCGQRNFGTSLFQIIFVTAFTTLMHAVSSYSVDILLAVVLIVGGVIGAQIGTQIGMKLKAEQLRILLAILVLAVAVKIGLDLVLTPDDLYSLAPGRLP